MKGIGEEKFNLWTALVRTAYLRCPDYRRERKADNGITAGTNTLFSKGPGIRTNLIHETDMSEPHKVASVRN